MSLGNLSLSSVFNPDQIHEIEMASLERDQSPAEVIREAVLWDLIR